MKSLLPTLRILLGTTFLTAAATLGFSQTVATIKTPDGPLRLKSRGSFIVGGDVVSQTPTQLSSIYATPPLNAGDLTVNQMYVEFMVPERETGIPVVMLHGATLSGKTYDTTPDGRMGWYEYFVRRAHPVYVPDQVSRARSGVDVAVYNDVRAGKRPASDLPNAFRISAQLGWTMFRLGPSYGTAFPDQQFPTQAAAELARQAVPDLNATLPTPNPNIKAMADLAAQLKGAVLMGHSETGALPLDAVLTRPGGIKAVILVEPGTCQADAWSDEQIASFARVPILVLFADHLDVPTGSPGFSWKDAYTDSQKFITRVRAAGGKAEMLYLPDKRIFGNSHVMMMDKNNMQIADLLLQWVQRNTAQSPITENAKTEKTGNKTENVIFPKGDKAPPETFTGTVFVQPLAPRNENNNFSVASVTFEPGARAFWHNHPAGQTILVTEGRGLYQEKGKAVRQLKKGDVVLCPPETDHWHGASSTSQMTHVVITNYKGDSQVNWLKPVTDEEYKAEVK